MRRARTEERTSKKKGPSAPALTGESEVVAELVVHNHPEDALHTLACVHCDGLLQKQPALVPAQAQAPPPWTNTHTPGHQEHSVVTGRARAPPLSGNPKRQTSACHTHGHATPMQSPAVHPYTALPFPGPKREPLAPREYPPQQQHTKVLTSECLGCQALCLTQWGRPFQRSPHRTKQRDHA